MIEKVTKKDLNIINSFTNEYQVKLENNPYNRCYLIKKDNEILGYVEYAKIYDKAELNYIYILEKHRRNGYAQDLFDYMEKDLDNIINITLEVRVDNINAIKFYEKNGFKIVSKREKYYNGIDGYLMLKVVK